MRKKLKAMHYELMVSIVFFSVYSVQAQTDISGHSIKGQIYDTKGTPLAYANVFITVLKIGSMTNEKGQYQLENIPQGSYLIKVSLVGYKEENRSITIQEKDVAGFDFILVEETQNLDEVVVQGKSPTSELRESTQTVTVVETGILKLQTVDLGEIMAKTEGVSVQRAGGLGSNTRFAINGLSGDQIRFFYNGIPLEYTPYATGIANVPVNLIDRAEVYKGLVPIKFGVDALGGAVNIVPSEIKKKRGGSASYQVGSFGTHRATANIGHWNQSSGFFVAAGSFYDITDNDYKIDAVVPDERGQLQPATVRRFHDGYRGYGANLRTGFRYKKWAKEFSLEVYYGNYNNEIQNSPDPGLVNEPGMGIKNAIASSPYGDVFVTSISKGLNLSYSMVFGQKLDIDLKAGYNENELQFTDVGKCLYDWFGNCIRVNNTAGEIGDRPINLITANENSFVRQTSRYQLSETHSLELSIAPNRSVRFGDDVLVDGSFDPALARGTITDFVTGLGYNAKFWKEKFENNLFVKNYRQTIKRESVDPNVEGTIITERSINEYGVGNGLRVLWFSCFETKLSYEYALRLPGLDELFGDGQFVLRNLELTPETSHNLNLQWILKNRPERTATWNITGNFFLRKIDELIFAFIVGDAGSYQNISSASSKGVEFGGSWTNGIPGLAVSANATYQDFINTSETGPFAGFKGDRVPNRPYLFANGNLSYEIEDVFFAPDGLNIFASSRYVHGFFIGWESAGLRHFKFEVPDQLIHNVGITYNLKRDQLQGSLTIEMQNLANAKVFDFFGVQRPGRGLFIKFTKQF